MDARLKKVVAQALRVAQKNPGGAVDSGFALQAGLIKAGLKDAYDDEHLREAAKAVGVPDEEFESWMESFASWI